MITSVHFENYKLLRKAELPLGRLTLLIGPNASGKSTALQAMQSAGRNANPAWDQVATSGLPLSVPVDVKVTLDWASGGRKSISGAWSFRRLAANSFSRQDFQPVSRVPIAPLDATAWNLLVTTLSQMAIYSLSADALAGSVALDPGLKLQQDGSGLAGVLDQLRDNSPETFKDLNEQLRIWLPEFDQILFRTPETGKRSVQLRTRAGQFKIPSAQLSHGTLLALGLMTIAFVPETPQLLAIEEPERGLHPRLLRDVRDALFRMCYPEQFNLGQAARQVIVTTHSPYLLDLFRETPEDIVIAQKGVAGVTFERLSDRTDLDELLRDVHLGDAWYSGALGGVPAEG